MPKDFPFFLFFAFASGCSVFTPMPPMPPSGPVATPEQAIRIAINKCGGWRTAEEKVWDVRHGYESWVAEYDGELTFWSDDNAIHVKAIVDESTGKLLNCINEATVVISVTE
jgi:hypothetical protein